MSDWTGNSRSAHAILGARNYAQNEREVNDYYATEPKAAQLLMEVEQFAPMIWECACGEGHLAKEFERAGYHVYATDLIDRGFGHQQDFLKCQAPPPSPDLTSLQTRHIQRHRSLSSTPLTSRRTAARWLCSSRYSSLKARHGERSLRNTRPKPYMSAQAACVAL